MLVHLAFGLLIGAFLGSLVKCLADRSLTQESFLGRSYCPDCKTVLKWYDLLPVVSYLLLKGSCRYCHKKIPLEYLFVEILSSLLIGLLFYVTIPVSLSSLPRPTLVLKLFDLLFNTYLFAVLLILFLTDLKKGLLPDRITIPSIVVTFLYLIWKTVINVYFTYIGIKSSMLGKYLLSNTDYFQRHAWTDIEPTLYSLGIAFFIAFFFASLIIVTRGRGMGGGDLKLGVLIGLALGFPGAVLAILLGFLFGSIVGLGLIIFRTKKFGQTIPFGPFLCLGTMVSILWGQQILDWYSKHF